MAAFHQICGSVITLSENRTVAENRAVFGDTLVSAAPLSPGETFSVRVKVATLHPLFPSHLYLGVTGQTPQEWAEGGRKEPADMTQTWGLWTVDGVTRIHGERGYCDRWRERFGVLRPLSTGDILSVSLCGDRSLSITHNNTEVTQVFTGLPDKPLWVIIYMWVKELEVLQPDGHSRPGGLPASMPSPPPLLPVPGRGQQFLNHQPSMYYPGHTGTPKHVGSSAQGLTGLQQLQGPHLGTQQQIGPGPLQYIPQDLILTTSRGQSHGSFSIPGPHQANYQDPRLLRRPQASQEIVLTTVNDQVVGTGENAVFWVTVEGPSGTDVIWFLNNIVLSKPKAIQHSVCKIRWCMVKDCQPQDAGEIKVVSRSGTQIKEKTGSLNVLSGLDKPVAVNLDPCGIDMLLYDHEADSTPSSVVVDPSEKRFFSSVKGEIKENKIYNISKAKKGKACIISLPTFEVPWLAPLPGYFTDALKLSELWDGMGLDVYLPRAKTQESRNLSAEEIRAAIKIFTNSLTVEDQMAALCILSHGLNGLIYGSDGNEVRVDDIMYYFHNKCCPKMEKKPKLLIIQACQGDTHDVVSYLPTAGGTGSGYNLPSVSDLLVAYPSLAGYKSYVRNKRGSPYIQTLVETFVKEAKHKDAANLLARVGGAMSEIDEKVLVGGKKALAKQMPYYTSFLTGEIYLLPCKDGKKGRDWAL